MPRGACTALTRLVLPCSKRSHNISLGRIDYIDPGSLPLLPRLRHLDLMGLWGLGYDALVKCFDRQPALRHVKIPASLPVSHDKLTALYPQLQPQPEATFVPGQCPHLYRDWD